MSLKWLGILPWLVMLGGTPFVNRVEPFVLGFPLPLAWAVGCTLLTAVPLAAIYALAADILSPECSGTFSVAGGYRRAQMNPSRTYASSLALGGLLATTLAAAPAGPSRAGDYDEGAPIIHAASRCAAFGPGFVDMGNGMCGRIGGHVRVQLGTRGGGSDAWTTGGTSSAALRSDGMGGHPRIYSGVGAYNPFQ